MFIGNTAWLTLLKRHKGEGKRCGKGKGATVLPFPFHNAFWPLCEIIQVVFVIRS